MRPDGKSASHENATKREGHSIIPTSPKSPVVSGSAFESVEDSDDEDMNDNAELETSYCRLMEMLAYQIISMAMGTKYPLLLQV